MTENPSPSTAQIRAQFAEMARMVARLSLENGTNEYRKMMNARMVARLSLDNGTNEYHRIVAEKELTKTKDELLKAQSLAMNDPMTGAYNRRGGEQAFEILHGQAQREGHMLAMIMLDLDKFKAVNDTYGHKAGDMVLIELVRRLKKPKKGEKALRENDVLARLGGEEFAILIPVKNSDEAFLVADKVRQIIKATPFDIIDDKKRAVKLPVTASLGIAVCTPTQNARCDLGEMQEQADSALYKAKEAGRDRTMIYEEKPSAPPPVQKEKPDTAKVNQNEIAFIMAAQPKRSTRGRKAKGLTPAPGVRGA